VAGFRECGDETSGPGATELVSRLVSYPGICLQRLENTAETSDMIASQVRSLDLWNTKEFTLVP
jgi:hypothetical protein